MTGWTAVAAGLVLTCLTVAWYAWWSCPGRRPQVPLGRWPRPASRRAGRSGGPAR